MIPMPLPPVDTPELFIPAKTPGFGSELDVIKSPPPGGGAVILPFAITRVTPAPSINVIYGTVMDVVPSGIATDTSLSNGTNRVYLDCTLDAGGNVTAVALVISYDISESVVLPSKKLFMKILLMTTLTA